MADRYQSSGKKSTKKFEVMGSKEVAVRLPLPLVEVWEELQPEVEHLTGLAGLKIIRAVIEDEVMRRVGPRHQPNAASSCLRWGQQSGYVVFAGQKVAVERPRVRTRQGEEVQLDSYARLQHDGRRQRAVREGIVAGLTSRNYRRAVHSVLDGYGIEKSSVSREFVQASAAQLKTLCERKLNELNLVAILIDGIHLGQQVLVVALGVATSGEKHVLGLWQGATENTTVVKELLEDLVARGLNPDRRYLFVIDGAKALRTGIGLVFGERAEVQRLPDSQAAEHRAFAEECPGRPDRRITQRLRDDRVRGSQSGARENLPATGTHQSQRGAQPGRRVGGNPHRAPAGRGHAIAANVGFEQSHRVVPLHGRRSGPECKALAEAGGHTALDSHGATGSGKEIPQGERLPGIGTPAE